MFVPQIRYSQESFAEYFLMQFLFVGLVEISHEGSMTLICFQESKMLEQLIKDLLLHATENDINLFSKQRRSYLVFHVQVVQSKVI